MEFVSFCGGAHRKNEQLSNYSDTVSSRSKMLVQVKKLIEANPLSSGKLFFPTLMPARLRTLINQSLIWQHQQCKNPRPNPDIKSLLTDHRCSPPDGPHASTLITFPVAIRSAYPPLGVHVFPPIALTGWTVNANLSSAIQPYVIPAFALPLPVPQNQVKMNFLQGGVTYPAPAHQASGSIDDLPKSVACTIHQGSNVTSMDFHPYYHTLLTVGCSNGEISLWELGKRERLGPSPVQNFRYKPCPRNSIDCVCVFFRLLMLFHLKIFLKQDKAKIVKDSSISVNRVAWSPRGNFVGHEAPVYSICPHQKEYISMLYSADSSRLFSYGASKDGNPFLIEWNDSVRKTKRKYSGFRKNTTVVVQFDTTKNRFLAVGDDRQIKFWDMDNTNILTSTDAEGGLPSLPGLRFNKEGNLLVVTTADNGFKNGVEQMSRGTDEPRNLEDASDKTKPWELTETVYPTQCRTVTVPDNSDTASKVARLLYTNSGDGILALWSNGVQSYGNATASIIPQLWQPNTGLVMSNDVPYNSENAVPCLALAKNDSYIMSACGGKVSLFNTMTFKVITTFMFFTSSTFMAFHSQVNNIIAIGMEDSVIHIYNVSVKKVKTRLKGHQKRITGLAFSTIHNILVSSGADAQLFFWNTGDREKINSVSLQLPAGEAPQDPTRVEFHSDQVHLLVRHETVLAVYDANKMECIRQWMPQEVLSSPISSAAYSCNSQLVYATFTDGNIGVFDACSLKLRCRIAPSAQTIHALVAATHPQEANQLAVGLTDGAIKVYNSHRQRIGDCLGIMEQRIEGQQQHPPLTLPSS
ncbi:TOPLESS-related 2 isoform 3 [Hibiscus syriacus]|uniref:TOPLESS-related 2 isoform 3 n=1 Tax=Hibiscus syriacus TaxID=106335 RepID=A0A6A3D5U0_HIBSY|nr:TOPLESS-related 2 isoform 3 [Hibiscus syriacus]